MLNFDAEIHALRKQGIQVKVHDRLIQEESVVSLEQTAFTPKELLDKYIIQLEADPEQTVALSKQGHHILEASLEEQSLLHRTVRNFALDRLITALSVGDEN